MKRTFLLMAVLASITSTPLFAGDVDMKMTTSDGTTKISFQDSSAVEVSSVNSNGNAYFNSLTQLGTGGNVILSQNSLQTGTTFYVSSGTVDGNLLANNLAHVGGVINRNTSDVSVSNTAAETSIYSFSVPGNLLSTNRSIRVIIFGTYLNNSGATKTIRLRGKYGATTVCDKTSVTNAASATTGDAMITFVLSNQSASNAQAGVIDMDIDRAGAKISPVIDTGTAAEDSTSTKTLDVTITHSVANASTTFVKLSAYAVLE